MDRPQDAIMDTTSVEMAANFGIFAGDQISQDLVMSTLTNVPEFLTEVPILIHSVIIMKITSNLPQPFIWARRGR